MEYTNQESHAMSKLTTDQSGVAPSSEDTALMTRLGLLLGEHRVSTVKTQTHVHPVLSHHNSNAGFSSTERRKKAHLYTTSPASTLSDKGIGSSVGSFDSEFRNNLSALAEVSASTNRTGSLDSRTTDIPSHYRTDSGIPNHSRSSSDIVLTENNTDVSKPRLAKQCEEKLWNADPRRNSGNTQTIAGSEIRSRISSVGKARKAGDKSTDTSRERVNSSSDVMKLPQLCLDSPNNSNEPSIHSSVSSSRSLTPAASVCDVGNYKLMKRSLSSHSNNTAVFDTESLPPPPPPPPAQNYYDDYDDLPPPPPPPPVNDDMASNHSRASSSDRTRSNENFQRHYPEENNNFLHSGRVMGKPPINRLPVQAYPNVPQMPPPNSLARSSPHFYDQSGSSMIQMLRASSSAVRSTPSPKEDFRMIAQARQWPSDHEIAVRNYHQLPASMSAMDISHSRQSSANSSYAGSGIGLWDDSRPHSLSAPPQNPMVQNLLHKTSASFDNSGFHRRVDSRSSTRSNERRMPLSNASSTNDMRVGRMPPYRLPDVNLHSLHFELPWAVTSEGRFVGREWLFGEIMNFLNAGNSKLRKGVIIYGKEGTGKTTIIHQLESASYSGTRKFQAGSNSTLNKSDYESAHRGVRSGSPRLQRHTVNHSNNSSRTGSPALGISSAKPGSRNGSQTSLSGEEAQKRLSSQVVAHHYCQADNNTTCYVPEFLHSVAAQLAQAPQLTAYREFLLQYPRLQHMLNLRTCLQNPSQTLKEAILDPLITLRLNLKLPRINLLILIDGLGEAELHRPDHGHSILTFLQRHLPEFPDFLKVVATCRTEDKAVLGDLPLFELSLDYDESDANVTRDIQAYIGSRIASSKCLSSLTLMGKPDTATTQKLLTSHLLSKCEGNMLYLRMTLDLIDSGKLAPKSSGFKVIPVNLSEAFLLMCNLKFSSASSFVRVRDIMAVALASLYPLRDDDIYKAVTSGLLDNDMPPDEFHYLMESVSQFLVLRSSDNRRAFLHPCFREWLTHGNADDNQNLTYSSTKKFAVDPKRGHALLATVLSRQPSLRLNEHAALELAHHLLKARMFRGQSKTTGMNSNELHSVWMGQCSSHLSDSLATVRNLFYPNIKVSKLLLHSGANPNARSQVLCEAPAICAAGHIGSTEFVDLLLSYRADINMPATNGMTCLAYAAAAGHKRVVELLLRCKPSPRLDLVDRNGHSPVLHAISRNHIEIAILLLTCDLYVSPEQRKHSAVQALIAAATTGSMLVLQYLLDHHDPALNCDPDSIDPTRGESALTAAASRGKEKICEYLVQQRRANIEQRNKAGMTPLLCAVKQGEWETVHLLLNMGSAVEGADYVGRTPLIVAASVGHTGVMELLLSQGANVHSVDKEGLTALGWAALKGHLQCARSLMERGSDIRHPDKHGRTPIDLAAYSGSQNIVELLLSAGADLSQQDFTNMSPLDRAIVSNNPSTAAVLLRRGVAMTDATWKLALPNPDVLILLLEKCIEDANFMYKEGKIREARDVYSTALYHLKEPVAKQQTSEDNDLPPGPLSELTSILLLGLARCARKLNDLETAEISATRALELKPHWYEALYVRARTRRETSRLTAALQDVEEAEANAPPHNAKEIGRLLERIREDISKSGNRNSISESSEGALRIPGQRHNSFSGGTRRPRANSASGYGNNNNSNNNTSRPCSPSPPTAASSEYTLSHSYQPQHYLNGYAPPETRRLHNRLPYLSNEIGDMRRNHSQDNVCQSRMGGGVVIQQAVPHQHRMQPPIVPSSLPYNAPMPVPGAQQFNNTLRSTTPAHPPRRRTVATEL